MTGPSVRSFARPGKRQEMHHTAEMLRTHPSPTTVNQDALKACIEACYDCAQACTGCADACLAEENVTALVHCIRLNQDCADICETTGRLISRQTEPDWTVIRTQLEACIQACSKCGAECARHADHMEHCRVCAEA